MKIFLSLILLALFSSLVLGERVGELTQLMRPDMFDISRGELFVADGSKILVYNLKSLKLLRQFGKEGEGPGELRKVSFRWNMLHATEKTLFVDGYEEILEFSREGKVLNEKKKPYKHFVIRPMGDRLVTLQRRVDRNKIFVAVTICDKNFALLKQFPELRIEVTHFAEALNYWTADNKIFIERSDRGFVIEIYDQRGKLLNAISRDAKKRSLRAEDKEWAENYLKNDPETRAIGNIDRMVKEIPFPDYFPFIREITAAEGKIFIQTFHRRGKKIEYIVLDYRGKLINRIFLPEGAQVSLDDEITGRINRFYHFLGDFYYYILENETSETWELHRVKWKEIP